MFGTSIGGPNGLYFGNGHYITFWTEYDEYGRPWRRTAAIQHAELERYQNAATTIQRALPNYAKRLRKARRALKRVKNAAIRLKRVEKGAATTIQRAWHRYVSMCRENFSDSIRHAMDRLENNIENGIISEGEYLDRCKTLKFLYNSGHPIYGVEPAVEPEHFEGLEHYVIAEMGAYWDDV